MIVLSRLCIISETSNLSGYNFDRSKPHSRRKFSNATYFKTYAPQLPNTFLIKEIYDCKQTAVMLLILLSILLMYQKL